MPLYFMRHAQTPGNAKKVWVGRQNEDLSEQGTVELKSVANGLATLMIDYIYVSPMQRALSTARIVAEKQKGLPVVEIRESLQERDFGCFQGQKKTPENRRKLDIEPSVETLMSMRRRLAPVLREVSTIPGNVLIISHSAVYRCIIQTMGYTATSGKRELGNTEWVELLYSPDFVTSMTLSHIRSH